MRLRPRQKTFVERSVAALATRGNTLGVAPTGAGKTIMLSAVTGEMIGDGAKAFNDCRDCNPYPPFTAYASSGGPLLEAGPIGLTGFEPLGRFRQGPLGSADKEDEVFITMGYQFF